MAYRLVYHPAVLEEDFPAINRNLQRRITRALEERLAKDPVRYGEPLRHQLKGYWKMRVGDYRVVYQMAGQDVQIVRIDHRKTVYALPPQRLLWHP